MSNPMNEIANRNGKRNLNLNLPAELFQFIEQLAAETGRTKTAVACDLIHFAQKSMRKSDLLQVNTNLGYPGKGCGETQIAHAQKKRSSLSPDWKPSPELIAWVRERWKATDEDIRKQTEHFVAHHVSKGNTMASWPMAWRTWWSRGYHKIPTTTGSPNLEEREQFERFLRGVL
jgi:hypothetical protein